MTPAERRQQAEDLGLAGHDAESFIAFHAKEDAGAAPVAEVVREAEPPPMMTTERATSRSAPTAGPARASAPPPASQPAPSPAPPPMMAVPVTHHAIRPAPVDRYATSPVVDPMVDVPDFPVSDNSDPPSVAYRVGRGVAHVADIPAAYGRLQDRAIRATTGPGVEPHAQASLRASNAAGMEMARRAGQAPMEAARKAGQAVAPVVADITRGYGSVRPAAPKPPDYGTSDPGEPAPRQPVVVVRPAPHNPRPAATVAAPVSNPVLDDAMDFLTSQGYDEGEIKQAAATPEGQQLLIRRAAKYKAYLDTQAAQ